MLESECGTKWCPEWRSDHQYGDNRWTSGGIFTREAVCIGSKCAQWINTGYDDKAGELPGWRTDLHVEVGNESQRQGHRKAR